MYCGAGVSGHVEKKRMAFIAPPRHQTEYGHPLRTRILRCFGEDLIYENEVGIIAEWHF